MLVDVFAPSNSVARQSAMATGSMYTQRPEKVKPSGTDLLWNAPTEGACTHGQEVYDMRAAQLLNGPRPAAAFDRVPEHAAYQHHYHHAQYPREAQHYGALSQAALKGLPVHTTASGGHSKERTAKHFSSEAERRAYQRFQSQQKQPNRHTTFIVTNDAPAAAGDQRGLKMHSRRTWDGQVEREVRASRTDNSPYFHSTMLRAMAHAQAN